MGIGTLSFDARGCGRSSKDFSSATIVEMATDVRLLIEISGACRVVLVGWSIGGAVAVEVAASYPDAVRGLVLHSPATPTFAPASGSELLERLGNDKFQFARSLSRGLCAPAHRDLIGPYLERQILNSGPIAIDSLRDLMALDQTDTWSRVSSPWLGIFGRLDLTLPADLASEIAREFGATDVKWLEESGHCGIVEQPGEFSTAAISFASGIRPSES
jgi:pimeloyl-ACP methyl ester carboxylesterase